MTRQWHVNVCEPLEISFIKLAKPKRLKGFERQTLLLPLPTLSTSRSLCRMPESHLTTSTYACDKARPASNHPRQAMDAKARGDTRYELLQVDVLAWALPTSGETNIRGESRWHLSKKPSQQGPDNNHVIQPHDRAPSDSRRSLDSRLLFFF